MKVKVLKDYIGNRSGMLHKAGSIEEWVNVGKFGKSLLDNGFVEEIVDTAWKPKKGDLYYYVCSTGEPDSWWCDVNMVDAGRASIGNCFKTREEAKKAVDWLKAFKVLRDDTHGYRVRKNTGMVWMVVYDVYTETLTIRWLGTAAAYCDIHTPILFKTEEDAQQSIDKHTAEWKTFLGVE